MKFFSIALITLSLGFATTALAQTPQEALDSGNIAQAQSLLQAQSNDEATEIAVAGLCGQAQIAAAQSNYDKALELLDEAENKLNDDKKEAKSGYRAIVPYLKAGFFRAKGDYDSALAQIKKARDIQYDVKLAEGWEGFIEYEASLDYNEDNSHARKAAEAAINAFHDAKLHREQGYAEIRLADLEFARGKERRGFSGYDNAIKAFRTDGESQKQIAQTQLLFAEKHIAAEDFRAANSRLETAQKEIEAAGSPQDLVDKMNQLKGQIPSE